MNSEIIKAVVIDKETYLAYANLRNAYGEIRKVIIGKANANLRNIAQVLKLEILTEFSGRGEKEEGFFLTTPALRNRNLRFGIQCEGSDYQKFFFGFTYISDTELKSELKSKIELLFKEKFRRYDFSNHWPVWLWLAEPYTSWNDETMAAILSGGFTQYMKQLIGSLSEIAIKATESDE